MNLTSTVIDLIYGHQKMLSAFLWSTLAMGCIQDFLQALQTIAAWRELRNRSPSEDTESPWQILVSGMTLPISMIIPAHNEEAIIVTTVQAILALQYAHLEIIVVNDGSTDHTLSLLIEAFQLTPAVRAYTKAVPHAVIRQLYASAMIPHLLVIDKEKGQNKADACNAGLNLARQDLFCIIDADSMLDLDSLIRATRPFMEEPKYMIAVGGTVKIRADCSKKAPPSGKVDLPTHILPLIQYVEYIRTFRIARVASSRWNITTIISGTFGIFNRQISVEIGGFSLDSIGEDYDLIMKMHRYMYDHDRKYYMTYLPEPICWTEGPWTLKMLSAQRIRWHIGALEVFCKYIKMFLNPKYGRIGMLGLPHHFIVDILGPIFEIFSYIFIPFLWYYGVLNMDFVLAYIVIFFFFGACLSVCALLLEEMEDHRVSSRQNLFLLVLVAVLENFGYRQLNNIWRLIGFVTFLCKKKSWGLMTRKSF